MSGVLELDLQVPCGRFEVQLAWRTAQAALGLFGPSGAGKTTVLESIAGLRRDARGRIVVNGQVWLDSARGLHRAPEQRGVGYVPQDLRLFPHLDVFGNLAVGARRAAASARRLRPEQVLDVLELTPLARLPVTRLSGGERQRVALARALCSGPELLLLDEPLASLDLPLRRRILPHLLRVREEFGIPTIHVSHDVAEVTLLCAEVCVLAAGQVVAHGRPEEVFATQGAAAGPKNVLQGKVIEVGGSLARVEIEPGLALAVADDGTFAAGQRVALELAASDVLIALAPPVGLSAQNVFAARVREVHLDPTGDPRTSAVVITTLGREARSIAVVVSQRACHQLALAPGVTVHLIFKAQACRLLAAY